MKYISTRGSSSKKNFEDVIISSLAENGGLYIPEDYPVFSPSEIASMGKLSYCELAFKILSPFTNNSLDNKEFMKIIEESYSSFDTVAVAPLRQINNQKFLMELFHGPTLAFKDIALQFMGKLFDYILEKRKEDIVIIGATSGDTGSAAIEGCYRSKRVKIFMMHPENRISEVQRRQMTTINSDNVFNIALEGTFDNCQDIMKKLFSCEEFPKKGIKPVAVNSVNWCRIMAQIVYYFYAAVNLGSPYRPITFSVPVGNFGNIFAGYLASKMGLPISKLIAASNSNDIIYRSISNNDYSLKEVIPTITPSMDIQKASNFERLLFELSNKDYNLTKKSMEELSSKGIILKRQEYDKLKLIFKGSRVDDKLIYKTMQKTFEETGILTDPHTATSIFAAEEHQSSDPTVILSTAHPAKFPETVKKAGINPDIASQDKINKIMDKEENFTRLPNNYEEVKNFIMNKVQG